MIRSSEGRNVSKTNLTERNSSSYLFRRTVSVSVTVLRTSEAAWGVDPGVPKNNLEEINFYVLSSIQSFCLIKPKVFSERIIVLGRFKFSQQL